jgi:hypothetical protein
MGNKLEHNIFPYYLNLQTTLYQGRDAQCRRLAEHKGLSILYKMRIEGRTYDHECHIISTDKNQIYQY